MPDYGWIIVERWDDFQHRDMARTKVPPWIKAYTRLLSDDDFASLSHHLRGVLLGVWLEYARSTRQLRGSTVALSRHLGQRVTGKDLEALNHAGFISFSASKPASNLASKVASLDGEGEGDPPTPSRNGHLQPSPRRAGTSPRQRGNNPRAQTGDIDPRSLLPHKCPRCSQRRATDTEIAEHLENVHGVTASADADQDFRLP